jgi:hypothetical protein
MNCVFLFLFINWNFKTKSKCVVVETALISDEKQSTVKGHTGSDGYLLFLIFCQREIFINIAKYLDPVTFVSFCLQQTCNT